MKIVQIILLLFLLPDTALAQPTTEEAFSPHQGATELVVKTIDEAQTSVRAAAYSFTSRPIAQALIDACRRSVEVQIVFDKSQRTNSFISHSFDNTCVQKRIDTHYAIMHDKFIIVDDVTLETGSYNFTQAAEKKNAENVLVVRDDPEVVDGYLQQWKRLWEESQ